MNKYIKEFREAVQKLLKEFEDNNDTVICPLYSTAQTYNTFNDRLCDKCIQSESLYNKDGQIMKCFCGEVYIYIYILAFFH